MIVNKYNKGGGGSISGGSADYATSAGEANKSKLLEGGSAIPQSANTGDVVALAPTPTRGLRSARTLGIYQYDGTNWNPIGGESSSAYIVELSTADPDEFTKDDMDALSEFFTAFEADPSIIYNACIVANSNYFRCNYAYYNQGGQSDFHFSTASNEEIATMILNFTNGYGSGSLSVYEITEPSDTFPLKPMADFPENPVDGEIVLLSEESLIDYRPEAHNGETVYGGNLGDFMGAVRDSGRNQLWLKITDGTPEGVELGYFHTENDVIDYYDYQGDMGYLFDELAVGEWVDANTIYLWKEGKNLYFYIKINGEDVYFPDTQSSMVFDTIVSDNTVNQYSEGVGWDIFPQALYGRADFPKVGGFGDVVGFGKYEEREATSADVFTSATVTMVNGRATFKMYNPNYSGYCEDYTFGYDVNEGIISDWASGGNVIGGPWSDHGVEFSIDGDDITFTTQNPDDTEEALKMWGFDPNCNDRITTKELGIYQRDEEGWNRAVTSNSINSIVKLTQAEYDALVSGGTVDENTFYVIIANPQS